jgi:hypothetical protein
MGFNEKTGQLGPSWVVPVSNAKEIVEINGSLRHALEGHPGTSAGCTVSLCAHDSASVFPHPVLMMPFVNKTNMFIVDKVKDGEPKHAVRYRHYLGNIVDLNDTDPTKKLFMEHPEIVERPFTLYPPKRGRRIGETKKGGLGATHDHSRSPFHLRGSVLRAYNANLIGEATKAVLDRMGIE